MHKFLGSSPPSAKKRKCERDKKECNKFMTRPKFNERGRYSDGDGDDMLSDYESDFSDFDSINQSEVAFNLLPICKQRVQRCVDFLVLISCVHAKVILEKVLKSSMLKLILFMVVSDGLTLLRFNNPDNPNFFRWRMIPNPPRKTGQATFKLGKQRFFTYLPSGQVTFPSEFLTLLLLLHN